MVDLRRISNQIPFLLCDFFAGHFATHRVKVFLCGKELGDSRSDLRLQVKALLATRMGCSPFLGEEIAELRTTPKVPQDHLTIEVQAATGSDLVLIFLGSPGTLAEVTAFALNAQVNSKLVVFNETRYKQVQSFVNLGPLRLIDADRTIFFDPDLENTALDLVRSLDAVLARFWFSRVDRLSSALASMSFEAVVIFLAIVAQFPVRYEDLAKSVILPERHISAALKELFGLEQVQSLEGKYLPSDGFNMGKLPKRFARQMARVRLRLLALRLRQEQYVSDYRLVM